MKLNHKLILLVSIPTLCLIIITGLILKKSNENYTNFKNFDKVTQLLIASSNLTSSLVHEKHMTWGAITLRGRKPPEQQKQIYRDAVIITDSNFDIIEDIIPQIDEDAYNQKFIKALHKLIDIKDKLDPIRNKVYERSINKDDAKKAYIVYDIQLKRFMGLLANETNHPDMVRKIIAQNYIVNLKSSMWAMRGYGNSFLSKNGSKPLDYQKLIFHYESLIELSTKIKDLSDDKIRKLFEEFENSKHYSKIVTTVEDILAKGHSNIGEANIDKSILQGDFKTAKETISTDFGEFISLVDEDIREFNEGEMNKAFATLRNVILFSIVALAICFIACYYISRGINNSILKVSHSIWDSSESGAQSSDIVSTSSQSLADNATQQAASLEEISASLEELTSMTKNNMDAVENSTSAADQAQKATDNIGTEISAMRVAMGEIKESSQVISNIIKTIEEIAFQTNILALNAAVEAARAGEAGAGFAVVAEEVRSLAQRSATAATETSAKIQTAVDKTNQGDAISIRVEERLSEIIEKSAHVQQILSEIDISSRQQNEGITQINTAVMQLDAMTQTTAAQAEETASASVELKEQSRTIIESVSVLENMVSNTKQKIPVQQTQNTTTFQSTTYTGKDADINFLD